MSVPHFDLVQFPGIHAQIPAEHDPDDTCVGDNQGRGFKGFAQAFKKGKDPVVEVIEAFSPGRPEGLHLQSPLVKQVGQGVADMGKGNPVPGSHVDFIEPGINGCFFSRADEVCRIPAPGKGARIDPAKPDVGKGVFPEKGLGFPGFIQGNIGLADEAAGFVSLYLSMAQQEEAGAVIGELSGWNILQPLRSGPVCVAQFHIGEQSAFQPRGSA